MIDYGFIVSLVLVTFKCYSVVQITWMDALTPFCIGACLELFWQIIKCIYNYYKKPQQNYTRVQTFPDGYVNISQFINGEEKLKIKHGQIVFSKFPNYYQNNGQDKDKC